MHLSDFIHLSFFHLVIYFNATLQNILTPESVKTYAFNISRKKKEKW